MIFKTIKKILEKNRPPHRRAEKVYTDIGLKKPPNIKMNYSIYLYFNHISYFTLKYANRLKICEMFEYTIGKNNL